MKSIFFTCTLLLCSLPFTAKATAQDRDTSFKEVTAKWFSAWALVCGIYEIDRIRTVDFLFFDETYVYSTSSVSTQNGSPIEGPALMNLQLNWKVAPHNGMLTLPDSTNVPVGMMSFAADNKNGPPFFVMPLPSFWSRAGVESKELGLANLVTGVFVHEFSHTQQIQNFGKKITHYEQQKEFDEAFDDDIVQRIFQHDPVYTGLYNREVAFFYDAMGNDSLHPIELKNGLLLMEERQQKFFKGKYVGLKEIEELFLTMEGLGQYCMYLWLTHPSGGNIDRDTAIQGVRRNKKWWSQDEGFAFFLLLEGCQHPKFWAKDMFGERVVNVTELLRRSMD